jgi:hypothetical protein
MSELRACPRCGTIPEGVQDANEGVAYVPCYLVVCQQCGCRTHEFRKDTDAIVAWNTIPPTVPLTPAQEAAVAEFVHDMEHEVIPEIIEAFHRRALAAAEMRIRGVFLKEQDYHRL